MQERKTEVSLREENFASNSASISSTNAEVRLERLQGARDAMFLYRIRFAVIRPSTSFRWDRDEDRKNKTSPSFGSHHTRTLHSFSIIVPVERQCQLQSLGEAVPFNFVENNSMAKPP